VEPVIEPTFEVLASEPVVEPTAQPAVEPTVEPAAQPTEEPPVEPVIEPTFEVLASEPVVEPTAQPTVEPTVEPAAQPTEEPPVEPTTEPVAVVPEPELTSEVVIAAPTEVVLGPEPSAEASPTEVVFAPIADPSPTEVALPDPTFVDAEPVASASAVFIPLPTDGVALAAEVIVPSTTTLEPPTETFDIPALVSNNLNFIAGGLGISADTDVQQNSDSSLDWDSRPVSFPNVPNRGRDPTNSNNVQGNTFSPSVTVFIIGITLCAVLVVAGLVGFARYRKRVPQPQIEEPKIIMVPAMERIPSPEMLNLVTELEQTGVSTLAINRIMESFRVSESGSRQAEILRDSLDMFDIAMPLVAEYAESVYQNTDRDDPFNDARSYTSSFE
jgi:hypothetical protein